MNRKHFLALALVALTDIRRVRAQAKTTNVAPGVTVDSNEALVAYVAETLVNERGQWANDVRIYVNVADTGFVRLTPCDDVRIICNPVPMRMEGVQQGDLFHLAPLDTESGDNG